MFRDHPINQNDAMDPMSFVLNIIWLVAGGAVAAFGWFLAAAIMVVTIIGIPFARAAFDNGVYTLWPFGVRAHDRGALYGEDIGTGPLGFIGNVIWFVLAGWWLALGHLAAAVVLAITVIGLPFAWAHLKLAGYGLWPIGRAVVRHDIGERSYAARRRY
ncbi:MAG: YccF domain-containing protein [Parvularculaceae bacterium]|nr:YccF domain-containing protein [Parvularculaceae bacterium]